MGEREKRLGSEPWPCIFVYFSSNISFMIGFLLNQLNALVLCSVTEVLEQ